METIQFRFQNRSKNQGFWVEPYCATLFRSFVGHIKALHSIVFSGPNSILVSYERMTND